MVVVHYWLVVVVFVVIGWVFALVVVFREVMLTSSMKAASI